MGKGGLMKAVRYQPLFSACICLYYISAWYVVVAYLADCSHPAQEMIV